MTRLSIRLRSAWLVALAAAAMPVLTLAGNPILESSTTGLLTFSSEDKALRVAVVFAEQDEAVVPTLVRVEVIHELPGARLNPYPILVTMQPLALGGAGRFVLDWDTGGCGCPTCGPPPPHPTHVDCEPEGPTDL